MALFIIPLMLSYSLGTFIGILNSETDIKIHVKD